MPRAVLIACRIIGVSDLITVALLSLSPADSIHRTSIGGHGEHLLAYAVTAFVLVLAARRRVWFPLLLTLIGYAGLLEALQSFVPGRTSQISDFLYSAAGVMFGALVAGMVLAYLRSSLSATFADTKG